MATNPALERARARRRGKGGGSHIFGIAVEAEGITETINSFNKLRLSTQLVAYRKAANKSVRAVRKTMKSLVPIGAGLTPRGESRPHLRNSLTFNVRTLGRKDTRYISGVVGADYKKVPTIHLVNNPVKAHKITTKKRALSNIKTAGGRETATIFGRSVTRPATPGLAFMQAAANANATTIKNHYVTAIREAVAKASTK